MAETSVRSWKDEGLDCLVLDEYLLPAPQNKCKMSTDTDNLDNVNAYVTEIANTGSKESEEKVTTKV